MLIDNDTNKTLAHALDLAGKRNLIIQNDNGSYFLKDEMKPLAAYCGNSLSQYFLP